MILLILLSNLPMSSASLISFSKNDESFVDHFLRTWKERYRDIELSTSIDSCQTPNLLTLLMILLILLSNLPMSSGSLISFSKNDESLVGHFLKTWKERYRDIELSTSIDSCQTPNLLTLLMILLILLSNLPMSSASLISFSKNDESLVGHFLKTWKERYRDIELSTSIDSCQNRKRGALLMIVLILLSNLPMSSASLISFSKNDESLVGHFLKTWKERYRDIQLSTSIDSC